MIFKYSMTKLISRDNFLTNQHPDLTVICFHIFFYAGLICVCVATDEGGAGEQDRHYPAGGSGPGGALPQSALLQRCSLLQPGEFNICLADRQDSNEKLT